MADGIKKDPCIRVDLFFHCICRTRTL